ncbi:DNA transposase [Frankliniella fusca]|uniref:DNA transposase n=1 Tax=Frankliniella fusca TaxID=407009 RepID=A0AAE1HXU7_9NEOP|nr:DNA transposase [Frankliniella fusca]
MVASEVRFENLESEHPKYKEKSKMRKIFGRFRCLRLKGLNKIEVQRGELRKKDKRIARLEKAVENLLAEEGVDIEEDSGNDFYEILKNSKLTPIQQLFLEQQLKATNVKNPRCRRWHPTLIRLALHLKMTSASTYEALRDSGAVILPSSRTLYDYSHAIIAEEGISEGILKRLHDNVQKKTKEYQKYCSLLCDEMYVSRNLVHRASDNSLIGYQNLDEVEKELANFETFVEGQFSGKSTKFEAPLAKTMLAFMVKGLCTDVKIVVAAFPMTSVTADNIYVRAWQVISRLEKAGIKIIAFVCDGAAPNRTFVGTFAPLKEDHSTSYLMCAIS